MTLFGTLWGLVRLNWRTRPRSKDARLKELEKTCRELASQTTDSVERAALLELAENYRAVRIE